MALKLPEWMHEVREALKWERPISKDTALKAFTWLNDHLDSGEARGILVELQERLTPNNLDNHRSRCITAIRKEMVNKGMTGDWAESYIGEAEHQDGVGYWADFSTPEEAVADFRIFVECVEEDQEDIDE